MKIGKILQDLDEVVCRVAEGRLYLTDDRLNMVITDWRRGGFWKKLGLETLRHQGMTSGVLLNSLFDAGDEVTNIDFAGAGYLDNMIRDSFREKRPDLMRQYQDATVIIHSTAAADYIVFSEGGEDLYIPDRYIYLLSSIGAKLMASKTEERKLSFHADPGVVGCLTKLDPEFSLAEPANEALEECQKAVEEFEAYYAIARRSPAYQRGKPSAFQEVKSEFLDTLRRISGYEQHQDRELNSRMEELIQEVFPKLLLSKGITYPIKATEFHDTSHPERFRFLDTNGRDWYVFVADWDQGYSGELGMMVPVTSKIASFLKRKMPELPVRR